MAEAQFDLCFSSDWESDGSYKDPPYLPEKDDVSSSSDSDSDEIQFQEKGVSVKRKRKAEKENIGESSKKVQRVQLENLNESTSEYLEKHQPANSRSAIQTAMNALKQVVSEVHPEETETFEEMSEEKLVDYLELFFKCVLKQDGKPLNASSLQTYYCSVRRYFVEKRQLDIKSDMKFSRVSKVLARRQEESMKEGEIPGKHAAKAIPPAVLQETIAKGKFGLSDPRSLTANVIKAFTAGFGIRTRSEMYNILNGDVKVGPLKSNGIPEYIELSERITKTRRGKCGKGGQRDYKPRIESDDEDPENCLVRPFLKMQSKKTSAMLAPDMPLFLTCLNGENFENREVWFSLQRMGINTVGTIVQKQIGAAGFDTKDLKISGTSVR